MKNGVVLSLVIASVALGCSTSSNAPAPPAQPGTVPAHAESSGSLHFNDPAGWVVEQPSSSMRVAQYLLPRAQGDPQDATLVVYYFGQGQGGSVQANLDRWTNQMIQPDGSPSAGKAKTEAMVMNGLNVTLLDVIGTYHDTGMGAGSAAGPLSNARMRAAVIETPKGAYFVKLVGPAKTVERWNQSFLDFMNSAEFK